MADSEKTVGDVINSMTEEQKTVLYALVGEALAGGADEENDEEGEDMKHNVFEGEEPKNQNDYLSHADQAAIIADAKRYGSLKESALQHGMEDIIMHNDEPVYRTYGVGKTEEELGYLFPEARSLNNPPAFISGDMDWVTQVMGAVHHTPFSRIKSLFANITEDEARAKGYIKGNEKKEEVFGLLKRTTTPQTIYKKQKLDRDDVIDITDFDIVAWLKGEMRIMLNEELARAILVGDGRKSSDDDKIDETHIRPVVSDEDLYTIKVTVDKVNDETQQLKDIIRAILLARIDYKGSGNPVFYTTESMLTRFLLLEDEIGRPLFETEAKLATKLRVSKIVTVPVMENMAGPKKGELVGCIVNLADYNVGADKGGSVSLFDDFDIDYNQQKYLIETRCSGALIKPYSAITIEIVEGD